MNAMQNFRDISLMKDLVTILLFSACATLQPPVVSFEIQSIPTKSLLQAISAVNDSVVWVSGHQATFARSLDGGKNWKVFRHPADTIQFRDIHAFDAKHIVLMTAGTGAQSRIFTVEDGVVWTERYVMEHPDGFLDCIAFWDDKRGVAYGDSIDEFPFILLTENGGKNWKRIVYENLPKAGKGEGGFAASGTCVTTGPDGLAWIATGAGGNARVLITKDFGKTWSALETPMVRGEAAGHTSVDFIDAKTGFITGGDLAIRDAYTNNCFFTTDGGITWQPTSRPITKGAFYGGSIAQVGKHALTFACGPNGLDYTSDLGKSWAQLDSANYWAVHITPSGTGWAVGKEGRVVKIVVQNSN
jgi:photosystem II stability/assembly factor-like uncharacterized protein